MSQDPLATVAVFTVRSDAELARAQLDAAGIRAIVFTDDEGGLNPGFFAHYGIRVQVNSEDAETARAVLGTGSAGATLPDQAVEAIVAHARFGHPEEACGLLAVDASGRVRMVYCLTNVDRSPHRFTVDSTEHYRAWRHAERNGWEIGGVFHSHPASPAFPSDTDIAGALDSTWLYVIVGLAEPDAPEVRVFSIVDGTVTELSELVGGGASQR